MSDPMEDSSAPEAMSWKQITLISCGSFALLFIVGVLIVVKVKSRAISESRRFPVFFFGLSMLGYLLLTLEIILHTAGFPLRQDPTLWVFYVVGTPLCFLPVMMLAWRIKIIYAGYFDLLYWKSVPLTHVNIKLGEKWLLVRLVIFMIPCVVFYPLIIYLNMYGDMAYLSWLMLYLLVFLYIVVELRRKRTTLKRHHQDQTVILFIFWAVQVINLLYTNLVWYLFNFAGQRYIVDLVSLIVLGVQVMTVCGLWYANYKVVKNRELQEKDKGLRSKGSLLGDGSENNQSQVTTVALPDEEDEIWKR